ncbi:MAG: SIS domain-containing protein [Microbacterium sp.]
MTEREILSQPTVWRQALELDTSVPAFGRRGERVLFLGCGTSAYVSESIAALREAAGHGTTDAGYASEWLPGRKYDRIVVISRSGTTSEVLAVLEQVPSGTATTAIVGVEGSPVAAAVDQALVLDFADESSVVQTRFPSTVLVLARRAFGEELTDLAAQCEAALTRPLPVRVADHSHFVFLGRTWTRGLAQEAALKVREAAQAWSEAYPALDYRHGPIAVAGAGSLVTLFGDLDSLLAADVRRTGAEVLHHDVDPLIQLALAQMLAIRLAEERGLDPDSPRHLTRSVVLS